ncbi:MAG: hypothetical protein KAU22_01265 [Desulfuromonadales bacterium]|nr:hypothetical protein [Desulfuromonadales bacterium]
MTFRLSNRRIKTDLTLQLLAWSNAIAVISLFIAICLIAIAKPKRMNFLDHFYSVHRSSPVWESGIFSYIGFTLLLSLLASCLGLYLNTKRLRRKGDHINATLVLSLIISTISLIFFIKHTLF